MLQFAATGGIWIQFLGNKIIRYLEQATVNGTKGLITWAPTGIFPEGVGNTA